MKIMQNSVEALSELAPSSKQTASQTANSVSSYAMGRQSSPQKVKNNIFLKKMRNNIQETFLMQNELKDLNINLENNDVFLAKSKPASPKQKKELCLSA